MAWFQFDRRIFSGFWTIFGGAYFWICCTYRDINQPFWWGLFYSNVTEGAKKMIKTYDLTKTYDQKNVIDAITLSIPKNKVTSIIGPNGAGKSTLLGDRKSVV